MVNYKFDSAWTDDFTFNYTVPESVNLLNHVMSLVFDSIINRTLAVFMAQHETKNSLIIFLHTKCESGRYNVLKI